MIFSHSAELIAQTIPDVQEPVVEIEFVESATADLSQVFTVEASDDLGLGDVTLHYRRAGENIFKKSLMNPIGDTGYFSISIDTEPTDLRAFEYYAQALDLNGNRTVKGFAFDPFVRELTEASDSSLTSITTTKLTAEPEPDDDVLAGTLTATQSGTSASTSNSNRKWWYIALGVLAVGAVASQLGGSDSGDGMNPGEDRPVPLTVILGDPL